MKRVMAFFKNLKSNISFLVLLLSMIAAFSSKAQISEKMKLCELDSINGIVIQTIAEVQPEYEGGLQKFYRDISSVIKVKSGSDLGCIKVVISFVVDVDGNIKNICITDNAEVPIEVIESINNWTPGKIGGRNIPVRMYLPMYIKLG